MKKYIITEQQIQDIYNIGFIGSMDGKAKMLESLKPIEPLSDDDIDLMWYEATAGRMHIKLARAIERHILGETQ